MENLRDVMKRKGKEIPPTELMQMIKKHDKGKDGKIDFEEFQAMMHSDGYGTGGELEQFELDKESEFPESQQSSQQGSFINIEFPKDI